MYGVLHTNRCSPEHIHLITEEAQTWAECAACRSSLPVVQFYRKVLGALASSLSVDALSFAVPSKLSGMRDRQEALRTLHQEGLPRNYRLMAMADEDSITTAHEEIVLGSVQTKHVPWLRPLLACEATIYLLEGQTQTKRTNTSASTSTSPT